MWKGWLYCTLSLLIIALAWASLHRFPTQNRITQTTSGPGGMVLTGGGQVAIGLDSRTSDEEDDITPSPRGIPKVEYNSYGALSKCIGSIQKSNKSINWED